MKDNSYYLNIFGMDIPTLDTIVATALRNGGDYCDLYFENTVYFNLMLKDGAVTSGEKLPGGYLQGCSPGIFPL